MGDKGQWGMVCNLIKKYGLTLVEDEKNLCTKSTQEINSCISYLMRLYALEMHIQWDKYKRIDKLFQIEQEALQLIYNILVDFYGEPAKTVVHNNMRMSPQKFFENIVQFPVDEYISILVDDLEIYTEYEINYDGNVFEGTKNKFLKLPNQLFEKLIEQQIVLNGFCLCSGDMGKFYIKSCKKLDDSVFDLNEFLNRQSYSKLSRDIVYRYHIGHMTHKIIWWRTFIA